MAAATSSPSVLVRFRPASAREGTARCADVLSPDSVQFLGSESQSTVFSYSRVFSSTSTQGEVFDACSPIVDAVLEGYNGTIMAFGQTGSGKTHSLFGDIGSAEGQGLVPRAIGRLLQGLAALKDDAPEMQFSITVSVVEIYCERIRDLLDPQASSSSSYSALGAAGGSGLGVGVDRERGLLVATGATEVAVRSLKQVLAAIGAAQGRRSVSATNMNERSSRSHCLVYLAVSRTTGDGARRHSKLCLVDLAGSERQDKTGAEGSVLDEAKLINKSLSALGNVVKALTEGSAHVPYRDSKLTRVLQDSLGGSAKTAILICCSPAADSSSETLSSLRFGSRAKGIQNTVQVASTRGGADSLNRLLAAARAEAEALRSDNAALRGQLQAAQHAAAAATAAAAKQQGGGGGVAAAEAAAACGGRGRGGRECGAEAPMASAGGWKRAAAAAAMQLLGIAAYWAYTGSVVVGQGAGGCMLLAP